MVSNSQKIIRIAAAALVALSPLVAPATADAKVTQQHITERAPFSQIVVFNTCTGDTVAIEGYFTGMLHLTVRDNITGHVNATLTWDGTGVGSTTGTEYVFSARSHQLFNFTPGEAIVVASRFAARLSTEGNPADDGLIKSSIQFVVNPDGTISHQKIVNDASECWV